jgi:hypothetical protein
MSGGVERGSRNVFPGQARNAESRVPGLCQVGLAARSLGLHARPGVAGRFGTERQQQQAKPRRQMQCNLHFHHLPVLITFLPALHLLDVRRSLLSTHRHRRRPS